MTSYLRAWGVFTHPTLRNEVQIIPPPDDARWVFDWTYYYAADCVYMHRPGSTPFIDRTVIEMSKKLGIPLWVDLDDDLESITPDNPVFKNYSSPDAKEAIQVAIANADILTCGGQTHYERLARQKADVVLLPNSLDDRLLHLKRPFKYRPVLAWRGSESHRIDLHYYEKEIAEVLKQYPECVFFGFNPYHFDWLAPGVEINWQGQVNLIQYYIALCKWNAAFHFVPMIDTTFNRVKSNLAWSDATLAGSVVLGPDFEEYRRPGVWRYTSEDRESFRLEFFRMLRADKDGLEKMHQASWDWIRDNILASKINLKRLEIIRNL